MNQPNQTPKTSIPREKACRKIALGIIVYNASETTSLRIQNALDLNFFVYLFDNSPEQALLRALSEKNEALKYLTCGKNVGLGYALSNLCSTAYYDGFSALLFFDQDTVFTEETLIFIEQFYLRNTQLNKHYSAIQFDASKKMPLDFDISQEEPLDSSNSTAQNHSKIGPLHPDLSQSPPALPGSIECAPTSDIKIQDTLLTINSGSLFFLDNLKKMGWHNQHYFVDGVDYEFCLNSIQHHFKLGKVACTPGFDHTSEQADQQYTLLGRRYSMRAYSFSRFKETVYSSSKLMTRSLLTGHFLFMRKISRLLCIYILSQILVRMLNLIHWRR